MSSATKKPIITICSSASFYRKALDLQEQLEALGFTVLLPKTAAIMKETGNFDVSSYTTWFNNPDDYAKKGDLIRTHFAKITQADAILVLNEEKHGKPNYIGGNVLMEMALAFHLGKPIYIFNDVPEDSSFFEEILGMQPTVLQGQLQPLAAHHKLGSTANS